MHPNRPQEYKIPGSSNDHETDIFQAHVIPTIQTGPYMNLISKKLRPSLTPDPGSRSLINSDTWIKY